MTLADVEAAAEEAGIDAGSVRTAARRLDDRRGLRVGLLAVALGGAALTAGVLLLPAGTAVGWRGRRTLLHNEHHSLGRELSLLVPAGDGAACELSPESRLTAEGFCLWRTVDLPPTARVRPEVPHRPADCPLLWVRVGRGGIAHHEALFELPAAIEVERSGWLDQMGAGQPRMHLPPDTTPGEPLPVVRCTPALAAGGRP